MGKIRKCRNCKSEYIVPSEWPGCCSKECKDQRIGKHSKLNNKLNYEQHPLLANRQRWLKLRYKVFLLHGRVCLCCGSNKEIQVDHIKPFHSRKFFRRRSAHCFEIEVLFIGLLAQKFFHLFPQFGPTEP